MATKKNSTGLPREMPLAPGNRLAGHPAPKHVVAAEREIPWLAQSKQKWTRARVDRIAESMKRRASVHQVSDPQLTDIPRYRVLDEKQR